MTSGLRPVPNPAHIEIRDGVRILTREGYAEAMKRHFEWAVGEARRDLSALPSDRFGTVALLRFDVARPKYGALDLDGTDWAAEGREEDVDGLVYRVLRLVRDRGL
jgi:hypothetical protein